VLDVDEKTVRNDLRTNSAASADNLRSLRQISKTLASRGHLTGGGKPCTATAVQKMLRGGERSG
jgi:hypothetical protein